MVSKRGFWAVADVQHQTTQYVEYDKCQYEVQGNSIELSQLSHSGLSTKTMRGGAELPSRSA
jgi:hypothetical protein